jgi:hypothetical protein
VRDAELLGELAVLLGALPLDLLDLLAHVAQLLGHRRELLQHPALGLGGGLALLRLATLPLDDVAVLLLGGRHLLAQLGGLGERRRQARLDLGAGRSELALDPSVLAGGVVAQVGQARLGLVAHGGELGVVPGLRDLGVLVAAAGRLHASARDQQPDPGTEHEADEQSEQERDRGSHGPSLATATDRSTEACRRPPRRRGGGARSA